MTPESILYQYRAIPGLEDYPIRVLAVRGYYDNTNPIDIYNDLISPFDFGKQTAAEYRGSVDPGRVYIEQPINPKGCARLQCGLWWFRPGLHHGHPAFVQACDFTVDRLDKNGNKIGQETGDNDTLGIHLHSGGSVENHVGSWSAGCQVIYSPEGPWIGTWSRFYGEVTNQLHYHSQTKFPYLLIDRLEPMPVTVS